MNPLDQDIQDLRKEKELLISLDRLMMNSDFKRVILSDYLNKHPIDLVLSKGKLNITPAQQLDTDRQLDAVALFKMYLDSKLTQIADIDIKILDAETLRDRQNQGLDL